jgi:ABC-type transport system involved in cytochrome c biogenesis ATPase subunit
MSESIQPVRASVDVQLEAKIPEHAATGGIIILTHKQCDGGFEQMKKKQRV